MYVSYGTMCVIYNKIKFITNILMLLEFTHFIFITIDTNLLLQTQYLSQNTHILSKSISVL